MSQPHEKSNLDRSEVALTSFTGDQSGERRPIAIIGIGCRFPGGVNDPESFWQLLRDGVDAVAEIPRDRYDTQAYYDPNPATPGKTATRWGGFLDQVDQFDAQFFGIAPREAERMDPQHRLLLEVAWEALEDAGQSRDHLATSSVGVYIGLWLNDYEGRICQDPTKVDFHMTTGTGRYAASGRLSYAFGLRGPSLTVDTGCSSSLVAIHLACQSLRNEECDMALVGGANVILRPHITIAYSQSKMMSPDGHCKFGDANANGYVRSEGVGVVVLKPLDRALADGDPVCAVILGSAVNNDGASGGSFSSPGRRGQEELLRKAYRNAGVSPGQVQLIEAHGTGTNAGDPVELAALGAVLAKDRPPDRPCLVGSVKTNLGHTEAASGIAGLIKVTLALTHRMIPASLHCRTPNPNVPWDQLPLRLQGALGPWPASDGPALAGVNNFGISGTNAHIVLKEPRPELPSEKAISAPSVQLLPLSAHTPRALEALVRSYLEAMLADRVDLPALRDMCYTAAMRRTHHEHRLAVVSEKKEELSDCLKAFLRGEVRPGLIAGNPSTPPRKPVFVFPGQGSQWLGMGRGLLKSEPVFRRVLEECEDAFRPYVDWSLSRQLQASEAESRLEEIDVVQPTLFAIEVALAALWRSWGIEPEAVVGHSMGEVAAAYVAGALSLEDAARVICHRSRLLKKVSGMGAMAMVELSLEEARANLRGYENRVDVGVSNGPRSSVLTGDVDALAEIMASLTRQGVFCRRVKVDVAAHSPQMDPLRPELERSVDGLRPRPASIPIFSTVTGSLIDGSELDAGYWGRNFRQPVLFDMAVERIKEAGYDTFIEASPHPVLLPSIDRGRSLTEEGEASRPTLLASLRRDDDEKTALLHSLGALYANGLKVNWGALHPTGGRCVRLPRYPWQRERFWFDPTESEDGPTPGHPRVESALGLERTLLGQHLQSSIHPGAHFWESDLSVSSFPFLKDHQVEGTVLLPAAAYLEMALTAATQALGPGPFLVERLVLTEALALPVEAGRTVQLVMSAGTTSLDGGAGMATIQINSRPSPDRIWTQHARATVRKGEDNQEPLVLRREPPEVIMTRCPRTSDGPEHYRVLSTKGLLYGPGFRRVAAVWRGSAEAIGKLQTPLEAQSLFEAEASRIALFDAAMQVLEIALIDDLGPDEAKDAFLPVAIDRVAIFGAIEDGSELWAHAVLRSDPDGARDTPLGDTYIINKNGGVVAALTGLRMHRLRRHREERTVQLFHEIQWQAKPRPIIGEGASSKVQERKGFWLIFADDTGIGEGLIDRLAKLGEPAVIAYLGNAYVMEEQGRFKLNPAEPRDFRQLLGQVTQTLRLPCRGAIHLWGLDTPAPDAALPSSIGAVSQGCVWVMNLVQALAQGDQTRPPKLWFVTSGAQAVTAGQAMAISQTSLWGMGRVIGHEHPEFRCTMVDLSPENPHGEIQALFEELWSDDGERQVALRGGTRFVARLTRLTIKPSPPMAIVKSGRRVEPGDAGPSGRRLPLDGTKRPFRIEVSGSGVLEDLKTRALTREKPGPGMVEIAIQATGLNFLNVLSALGSCPGYANGVGPLGMECAGIVSAVGEGVEDLSIGDEVMAIAYDSLGTHALADRNLVVTKPSGLSFEQGASIPIVFITAYYALHHLGRLSSGERVLIHAAAGGVGLAGVQVARYLGAEVFATAGSEEKREYLQGLGIQHVMDSRSLDFADEILTRSSGQGVEVVLNSLAGEAVARGLECLAPYGRFVELGKRDIYQNSQLGLAPFKKNLAYFAVDLDRMCRERPAFVGSLLQEVMALFANEIFQPLPIRVFAIDQVAEAFRFMAQAKHIGKIVVGQMGERHPNERAEETRLIRPDGTYLISGGLGGLGLTVARWLVEGGARHLALVGRSPRSSIEPAIEEELANWEHDGVQVLVSQADVAREEELAAALAVIEEAAPPLRGVFHAAGVLDDGILLQLSEESFEKVMRPKVNGGWNLHRLTLGKPLDLFVLFSSVASLLGTGGQGNYAAANAFLDGLAYYRRNLGLPALNINWGPWSKVGLAARREQDGRLTVPGLTAITPTQGIGALQLLLGQDRVQIGVMPFGLARWCEANPSDATAPFFARMAEQEEGIHATVETRQTVVQASRGGIREPLLALEPGRQRRAFLESYLTEQAAQVLRLAPSRLDPRRPLRTQGLDSLMTLEFRNRLEAGLDLTLSATLVWNYPTIGELVPYLASAMGILLEPERPANGDDRLSLETQATAGVSANEARLSPDEVESLLASELDSIDELLKGR